MAKKLKFKLPKRIAGVKIPKVVRKGPVADFLNSSAGQLIVAQALVAVGGAIGVKSTDPDSPVGDALRHPIEAAKGAGRQARAHAGRAGTNLERSSARLAFAFNEAVRAFKAALEQPSAVADLRRTDDVDGPKKKPQAPGAEQAPH